MPLKFENSNEAFLSVLAVVIGADQVGSVAERDFLFDKVKGLPSFSKLSLPEFSKLLGQVTDKVYSAFAAGRRRDLPRGPRRALRLGQE